MVVARKGKGGEDLFEGEEEEEGEEGEHADGDLYAGCTSLDAFQRHLLHRLASPRHLSRQFEVGLLRSVQMVPCSTLSAV